MGKHGADGDGEEEQVTVEGGVEVGGAVNDGMVERKPEGRRIGVRAHDFAAATPQRQRERATHQPKADDGDARVGEGKARFIHSRWPIAYGRFA